MELGNAARLMAGSESSAPMPSPSAVTSILPFTLLMYLGRKLRHGAARLRHHGSKARASRQHTLQMERLWGRHVSRSTEMAVYSLRHSGSSGLYDADGGSGWGSASSGRRSAREQQLQRRESPFSRSSWSSGAPQLKGAACNDVGQGSSGSLGSFGK